MDVGAAVPELVRAHPAVRDVRLVGSRSDGSAHELSDWDFSVTTEDFAAVERDLPGLLEPLGAVAEQWDRYSAHACYMLILDGPLKVDLLFLDRKQEWAPPWDVTAGTLGAIDAHFWDWILWLEQKRRAGRDDVLTESLRNLHELLLRPLGVTREPRSVAEATSLYLAMRGVMECRYGIEVSRELEAVVRPVLGA